MALQGFVKEEYLQAKLTALQTTETEWVGKTTTDLENLLINAGMTAESHYQTYGWTEGLAPNNLFNQQEYKTAKAKQLFEAGLVAGATVVYGSEQDALAAFEAAWPYDPYLHYTSYGSSEGVNPSNSFDESSYLASKLADLQTNDPTNWPPSKTEDDVRTAFNDAGMSALGHYQMFGKTEGIAVTVVPAGEQVTSDTSVDNVGTTYALTTGADSGLAFTGTAKNDTFTAGDDGSATTASTWTAGDVLDGGGLGDNDTFNVTQAAALAGVPTGATVSNIETVNITSGGSVALDTTTGFSGLTTLNTIGVAGSIVTAASTTAVSVTDSLSTAAIAVNGGSTVSVTSTGSDGSTLTVGGTTAATGAVTVNSTSSIANGDVASAITVTGGTSVAVTQVAGNSAATGVDTTAGAVIVNGNASTTSVTVSDTAAGAGFTATTTATGVVGRVNGAVTITDINSGSTTTAGVITDVTLNSFAAATVNSGALSMLTLTGTGTSAGVTMGTLTTPTVTSLSLNVNGLTTTGAVTTPTVTTLNIDSSTAASTIFSLVAAAATTINVSGDAMLTLTGNTTGAVTAVNVTNTAGASFGTAFAAGVDFAGGAGNDTVSLGVTTKAITMGAGDDTVTSTGIVGAGGSVDAGGGTNDTIIMTTAEAEVADTNSTFNTKFTNFETLRLSNANVNDLDLNGINDVSTVILAAGSNGGIITNLVSGGTLQTLADDAGASAVVIDGALGGLTDVFNYQISHTDTHSSAAALTVANVETVNISTADSVDLGSSAVVHDQTLTAAHATSIVVTGNNGLNLTATGSTAVTNFDASGVVANNTLATATLAATTDTAANLAVTYISLNATATARVAITGGAGEDVLTGAAAIDTITGGEGADIIVGAAGNDSIVLTETTAAIDKVVFSGGAATNALTITANGVDAITGWGSTDTINVAALGDADVMTANETMVTSAAALRTLTDTQAQVITTDGTAGNITTGGIQTLDVTDYTAGTLTDLAAYLSEGFQAASAATTEANVFVINDANTDMTYVYNFINSTAAQTIAADEIVLVGTIDNGGTDLVAANVVFA